MEIWKDIKGYEGYYQVSSFGNIKSLSRKITRRKGIYVSKEKILKPAKKRDGYMICVLYNEGKKHTVIVHRIVAQSFIQNTENKEEVNHINGIRYDNRVENLEWNTPKENVNNSIRNGRWDNRIISVIQKNKKGELINTFKSIADAERETGIHNSNISACLKGKLKTTKGFTWSR